MTWLPLALLAAVGLLASVYAVAELSTPDPRTTYSTVLPEGGSPADAASILGRNAMVLCLHALACVAGFIAGSSLPRQARCLRGT